MTESKSLAEKFGGYDITTDTIYDPSTGIRLESRGRWIVDPNRCAVSGALLPNATWAQAERIAEIEAEVANLRTALHIAETRAYIAETRVRQLESQLAAFTATPAPEPKAFPAAALKPPKGDPRRVGG